MAGRIPEAAVAPSAGASRFAAAAMCAALIAATLAVFAQTWGHEFVNFDDDTYVYGNAQVRFGLTFEGIRWAFSGPHACNWHPLTTLSHMLDCQLWGLQPAVPHLENVLLHAANATLLFLFLLRATGAFWRSAFAAALFAVHPLRAESVAWLAERKDVLSGLFFLLTLHAYLHFARGPFLRRRFVWVVVLFALGLMCKPMLVTMPVVLLLLDYWPLRRFGAADETTSGLQGRPAAWKRLLWEKLPLVALAAASSVATIVAQQRSLAANTHVPFSIRTSVAMISHLDYLGMFFYPLKLGVLYPFPEQSPPLWRIAVAVAFLALMTLGAIAVRRTWPFVPVGWFWFVAMLAPVIGIVKVGAHAVADRYTYLPQIGLAIALSWSIARLGTIRAWLRWTCLATCCVWLALLAAQAARQTAYWRNSETLWTRAIECAPWNVVAQNNLGIICALQNRTQDAIAHWNQALVIDPASARAHTNLGIMLAREGRWREAETRYREALRIESTLAQAHSHLARALAVQGNAAEALDHARRAAELQPTDASNHRVLGEILAAQGQFIPAIASLREAIRLDPNEIAARGVLAWLLATCPDAAVRNGPQALALAQEIASRGVTAPELFDTLAAAYAETGRFPEAIEAAGRAVELAQSLSHPAAAAMLARQNLYRTGRPFRSESPQRPSR